MTSANKVHRKAAAPNPQYSPGGEKPKGSNFIRDIIVRDLESNKFSGRVLTRFPPEPNGYLHIGHAKATWISGSRMSSWGTPICASMTPILGRKRLSTSTPSRTVLGGWATTGMVCTTLPTTSISSTSGPFSSSRRGTAYVDDLSADEIREYRGTLTQAGKESPYRSRSVAENLDLFER